MANTSYSLDPNRDMSWMVVDMFDAVGREGIYSGTYEDCQMYMAEQAKVCSCIGMDIVPNPYYKKKQNNTPKTKTFKNMKKDYSIKWFKIKCSLYDQEFGITHWGDVVEFVNNHIGFDIEIKGQTTDPFTDVDAEYCDGRFVRM